METNLVFEGFKFMALGMGTVFLFLIIMIVMMNLMSMVIHRMFPEPVGTPAGSSSAKDKKAKIAAITAAIMHHRKTKA